MNNNFENFNNMLDKKFKYLTVPNGFKVKRENINEKLLLKSNFVINNKVIDENFFIKFYATIDPTKHVEKKYTKKNKHQEIKKSAKRRKY
jgi:hypothetical protein